MTGKRFINVLKNSSASSFHIVGASIPKSKYIPIDLSESNKTLNKIDVSSSLKLGDFVNNHIKNHNAKIAYGGYLEVRNIYKRSSFFKNQNTGERNIHLGIDFWCGSETAVYTPIDGVVHSFKNNTNHGDYGPTIILKHNIETVEFFTLYGHLSLASIEGIKKGDVFDKGQQIATLGDTDVNGDYPPHLHFQIIKDVQGFQGDYPGVCSKTDLDFYRQNCPNPNLLLKCKFNTIKFIKH